MPAGDDDDDDDAAMSLGEHDEDDDAAAARRDSEADGAPAAGGASAALTAGGATTAGADVRPRQHKRRQDFWKDGPVTDDVHMERLDAEAKAKNLKLKKQTQRRDSKTKREIDARETTRKLAKSVFKDRITVSPRRSHRH